MPNWTGGVLTAKGRALQAKVEAGQTLELTKMKLGSGITQPEEIGNLTDLKQPQYIMGISSKNVENNVCEITGVIITSSITTSFYAREWGLFANDPDEGEILYMYTTDPNPDYIPDKNSQLVISATYALNIAVLNIDNIVVNIDPAGLITTSMLEKELQKYLPLKGGTMEGLVNLFTGSTVPTPDEQDNSKKITNTEWVQTWVKSVLDKLSENIDVEWDANSFTVPALGITGLLAENGYIYLGKLFGGIIIQWGNQVNPAESFDTVTFPIAFTNKPFIVNCAEHSAQGWNEKVAIPGADASSATNINVNVYTKWVTETGLVITRGNNFEWFALGI